MTTFYEQFFAQPMPERQRIAQAAGLSLAYIQKHTYVQQRAPKFHFHNAVGLDRASNGDLCMLDTTEGEIDWPYVLERLKTLQKQGRIGRTRIKTLPSAQFEAFWQLYPRKVNKHGALKSWRAQDCDACSAEIMADIRQLVASEDWRKDGGKYIPHPTTYLNQRRWEATLQLPSLGTPAGVFAGVM